MMKSPFEFRNINVGDLLVQQIINPVKPEEFIRRRGIIVNIQNNISIIEWTMDGDSPSTDLSKTSIINSSLRKMILDGYIQHYPIQK